MNHSLLISRRPSPAPWQDYPPGRVDTDDWLHSNLRGHPCVEWRWGYLIDHKLHPRDSRG